MNNLEYTYSITSVDPFAKVMRVVYSSPGRQTVEVSTRLPYQDENIESVIENYAPVRLWLDQELEVSTPEIGTTGIINPIVLVHEKTFEEVVAEKKQLIAKTRYEREIGGILLNGHPIDTDRETQSKLSAALHAVQSGFLTSIEWKFGGATFVTLDLTMLTNVSKAVAQHVQDCFAWERILLEHLASLTTIEEVNSMEIPYA